MLPNRSHFSTAGAAILLKMSYAGSQLNHNVDRIDHSKCFYLQSCGHHGGDGADGMQKDNTEASHRQEEWKESTYTNCELMWKDKAGK